MKLFALVFAVLGVFSCRAEEPKDVVKPIGASSIEAPQEAKSEAPKADEEEKMELKKAGDNNSDHELDAKMKGAEAIKKMMEEAKSEDEKEKKEAKKEPCRDAKGKFMKCPKKEDKKEKKKSPKK